VTWRARVTPRHPHWPQLRIRVLAGVLAVTVIALVAFDVAAVSALRRYLVGRTDSQLQTVLSVYRPVARSETVPRNGPLPGQAPGNIAVRVPAAAEKAARNWVIAGPRVRLAPPILGQYYVAFLPRAGHGPRGIVVGNPALVPQLPPGPPTAAFGQRVQTVTAVSGTAQLRLRAVPVPAAAGTLVATTSLAAVNGTVGRLERILVIGSLAAALLVAVGVGVVVRRGLRPIETMATHADRITAGDLTDRVSPHDPATEVGRLGAALNGMLTRIQASICEREASQQATRRFFADASHELRNPLASLRANAELYQQGALSGRQQVDEAMRRIAAEAQRMSGLVDDMLRLARLDQAPSQHRDPLDLAALVTECAERAQITDPQRTWRTHVAPDLIACGDEELLRRAIDNLLANVQAHTPPGTVASITAARRGSALAVEISDNGPGVPAGQLPHIFDRFYRIPAQENRHGSGLGLAIVTAIAAAHNGTAEATINRPRGLRITLTLPACGKPCSAAPAAHSATPSPLTSPVPR
jgi:two-component system, OmpR family, sensor kinase